jgi:hypothetical protein
MPGVHSLPEKVLNDQQINMPHLRFFNSSARCRISTGAAEADRSNAAENERVKAVCTRFFTEVSYGLSARDAFIDNTGESIDERQPHFHAQKSRQHAKKYGQGLSN